MKTNNMTQLEKLEENYRTYRWNYERCSEFAKDRYYAEMQKAWAKMKEYKLKNCPELLNQPIHNLKPIPFIPMSDWTEKFEEYAD